MSGMEPRTDDAQQRDEESTAAKLRNVLMSGPQSARALSRATGIHAKRIGSLLRHDITSGRVQFSRSARVYVLQPEADLVARRRLVEAKQLLCANGYEVRKKGVPS